MASKQLLKVLTWLSKAFQWLGEWLASRVQLAIQKHLNSSGWLLQPKHLVIFV